MRRPKGNLHRPKATKFPLQVGKPARVLPSILDGVKKGTKRVRLVKAIANDNGGQWFLAESRKHSVAELEMRFHKGLMGHALYQRIGGLLQGPSPYIYIQVALVKDVIDRLDPDNQPVWKQVKSYSDDECWPEYAVEICLKEIGIEIVEPIHDIKAVLQTGRY
jgi:hypothetical protein